MDNLAKIDIEAAEQSDGAESGSESQGARRKRKGSPLMRPAILKKHNSLPDVSQALGSTSKTKSKKPKSFSDMMIMSFNDEEFINSEAPKICHIIQPLIEQTIKASVTAAVETVQKTVLDEILSSNMKLQQTINTQAETIQEQKVLIDSQSNTIDSNKRRIDELEDENHILSSEVDSLSSDVANLKLEVNRLEQYGRRSSIRFNNMNMDLNMNEIQMTKFMTNFINSNILTDPNSLKISEADIDRCHPVSGARGLRKPQIIVKFFSYKVKALVYGRKSKLKNHPDKTFVTEDLTRANHKTVQTLLKLKRNNKIDSFWTTDGKVLVKPTALSKPFIVSSNLAATQKFSKELEELEELNDGVEYVDAMDDVSEAGSLLP